MKDIKNNIERLKKELVDNEEKLKDAFFSILDDLSQVNEIVIAVENSTNYCRENIGPNWPCQYVYFDKWNELKDSDIWPYLVDYLAESHGIYTQNDSFTLSCGPAILIQDDGSVWDQDADKIIFNQKDFENEKEFFQEFEDYFEKTGVYGGVFRTDYYGEIIEVINTQKYLKESLK